VANWPAATGSGQPFLRCGLPWKRSRVSENGGLIGKTGARGIGHPHYDELLPQRGRGSTVARISTNPRLEDGLGKDRSHQVNRRELLGLTAALGATAAAEGLSTHDGLLGGPLRSYTNALPWSDGLTDAPEAADLGGWLYLNAAEVAFLTAVVDRLIPPDPTGPGGSEAGVVVFLDRQLAGDYGKGAHFYLGGPWREGTPTQGYQSRFTPAQFYRHAIAAVDRATARAYRGKSFKELAAADQDALLKQMESGELKLDGPVPSKAFFSMLLQNVLEGYFSDPLYGGNRGGAAWKMIGFPGAHYDYSDWVTAYNRPVPVATVGLRGRRAWDRA
jgi:gluconate 2-dehydrogenase gamma chain